MAKNNYLDVVLQPSTLHISPIKQPNKPLISKIRPPAPFSDWACPSLPLQEVMDKHLISPLYKHLVLDSLLPLLQFHGSVARDRVSPSLCSCSSSAFVSEYSLPKLSAPTCSSTIEIEEAPLTEESCEEHDESTHLYTEQSESGWTSYFDLLSEDCRASSNNSLTEPEEGLHEVAQSEDSSVISDASSGPERINISDYALHQPLKKRLFNDETIPQFCSEAPPPKLRRVEKKTTQLLALEDTATSLQPCYYWQQQLVDNGFMPLEAISNKTGRKTEEGQTQIM